MKRRRHWSYTGERNRLTVLKRDGYRCQIVGPGCLDTHPKMQVDHIVARELGGSDGIDNLRAACRVCNNKKGTKLSTLPKPVFSQRAFQERPLPKISPKLSWNALKRSEYR